MRNECRILTVRVRNGAYKDVLGQCCHPPHRTSPMAPSSGSNVPSAATGDPSLPDALPGHT
eukprot:7273393-Prorocentrum_lima.AAC.1